MTLTEEYDRLAATPSDIYEHLPRFVSLVHELDAKHVIELGTRSGVSTVAWLHGLTATGGRLTSVDIDAAPDIGWPALDWEFIRGDDCDPAVMTQLDPADIVFIDTSHLYDHTLRELYLYRWLVKGGGVIVLHDTELRHPEGAPLKPAFPVRTAVEDFIADTGYTFTNYLNCNGLGVIEGF